MLLDELHVFQFLGKQNQLPLPARCPFVWAAGDETSGHSNGVTHRGRQNESQWKVNGYCKYIYQTLN